MQFILGFYNISASQSKWNHQLIDSHWWFFSFSKVWYEPTDISICHRIFAEQIVSEGNSRALKFISPNYYELEAMANHLSGDDRHITDNINDSPLNALIDNCYELSKQIMAHYCHTIVVTLGKFGVLVISRSGQNHYISLGPNSSLFDNTSSDNDLNVFHLPQENLDNKIANVSGAGDWYGILIKGDSCV